MTALVSAALALKAIATALSLALARRRRQYRPVAAFLVLVTVADFGRAWLHVSFLDAAPRPYVGAMRILGEISGALWLTWATGLSALSIAVFQKRRPWIVAVLYVVVVAALAAQYPAVRAESLRKVYLATELAALAVSIGSIVPWAVRRTELPHVEHAAMLLMVLIDLATLLGPYYGGFYTNWLTAQIAYLILYGLLILIEGFALRIGGERPSR